MVKDIVRERENGLLALISSERSTLDKKLDTEWEKEFALGWGWFHAKGKEMIAPREANAECL